MKLKPSKIRNPKELYSVLKKIKYLVSTYEIHFVQGNKDSWDFHNEIISEGQWPDFFINKYFDENQKVHFVLSCDTYHGNCYLKKKS